MSSKFPRPQMPQQQRTPDLSLAQDIQCDNCKNLTFQEVLLMKKVSALVSPNGREALIPIPTFACVACGYVNEMFRPIKTPAPQTPDSTTSSDEETATPTEKKSNLILEP